MHKANQLTVKIFADGANKADMIELYKNPLIQGFTTNPTLLRRAGVKDYEGFAREIVEAIPDKPISFEVFSDEFEEMKAQALTIASWGDNVYVKIPVSNTKGEVSYPLLRELAELGVKQNATAIMTLEQIQSVTQALANGPDAVISVFAGRIADTGRDPLPIMKEAVTLIKPHSQLELLWASPREVFNVYQANDIGCHIITVTRSLIDKLDLHHKNLQEFSLDTVKMFRRDALEGAYDIKCIEHVK